MSKKDLWPLLIKSSSIASLIVGLVFLAQVAWAAFLKLNQGVPFWLLLTSSASCFLFGWFLSLWVQSKRRQIAGGGKPRYLGQITFDYLPIPPTERGWHLDFDVRSSDDANPPEFSAAQNSPVAGSLVVNDKGRYYMDYYVEPVLSLANVVDYYVKPTINGAFYLEVNISSRDKTQTEKVWLRHIIGTGAPQHKSLSEWNFEVQGEILENGWTHLKLSINNEVASTFGRDGFVYQTLRRIRIRGSLSISPITFLQS